MVRDDRADAQVGRVRYLPSEPLLDAARGGRPWHLPADCPHCDYTPRPGLCVSVTMIAERLGTTPETVGRWRAGGQVRTEHAERFAHALGLLDHEVWPVVLDAAGRDCEGCGHRFVPSRAGVRFCGKDCYEASPARKAARAASARARYARNIEAERERTNRYKAESRRVVNAKRRAYYQRNRENEIAKNTERKRRQRLERVA